MQMMDEKQILVVKHSWSYVVGHKEEFCDSLCKHIIFLEAELAPLITTLKSDDKIAGIIDTIHTIVLSLPDFRQAEKEVLTFAAECSHKSITQEVYETGVVALIMTLEKKVTNWDPEFSEAWIFLFASLHLHFIEKLKVDPMLERLRRRKKITHNHEK